MNWLDLLNKGCEKYSRYLPRLNYMLLHANYTNSFETKLETTWLRLAFDLIKSIPQVFNELKKYTLITRHVKKYPTKIRCRLFSYHYWKILDSIIMGAYLPL